MGNNPVEYVSSCLHIGHMLLLVCPTTMMSLIGVLVSLVKRTMCCIFSGELDSFIKHKASSSYCSSLFGSELRVSSIEIINGECFAWRKALRRVWKLPKASHCFLFAYHSIVSRCLTSFARGRLILSVGV